MVMLRTKGVQKGMTFAEKVETYLGKRKERSVGKMTLWAGTVGVLFRWRSSIYVAAITEFRGKCEADIQHRIYRKEERVVPEDHREKLEQLALEAAERLGVMALNRRN